MLAQQNIFTTSGHYHLQVGHTHEDVDAALALVTSCLNACPSLETPRDVARAIHERLSPVFQKRGVDFEIEIVDTAPCLTALTKS